MIVKLNKETLQRSFDPKFFSADALKMRLKHAGCTKSWETPEGETVYEVEKMPRNAQLLGIKWEEVTE